jgi:hypothetical protein
MMMGKFGNAEKSAGQMLGISNVEAATSVKLESRFGSLRVVLNVESITAMEAFLERLIYRHRKSWQI